MFDLKKPCKTCPFRNNLPKARFSKETLKRIVKDISENNKTHQCHGTYEEKTQDQICAGSLILLEKTGLTGNNNSLRIAMRLRIYDPDSLDRSSPVFNNFSEVLK